MKKSIFEDIGLTKKEIEVYLSTVQYGPAAVSKIAQGARLPRQTTYSVIKHLTEQGLVEQGDKRGVKQFYADPLLLPHLIERKRDILSKQKKAIEKEIPKLQALQAGFQSPPSVRYYEGREGLERLFEDILRQHKKGEKIFRGYGVNKFKEALGNYLYDFINKRASYGVTTKLFIANAPDDFEIEKRGGKGREVKKINMKPQNAGMYLVGNRVYFFSYKDNVGIMIQNEVILELLKAIFDDHWKKTNK